MMCLPYMDVDVTVTAMLRLLVSIPPTITHASLFAASFYNPPFHSGLQWLTLLLVPPTSLFRSNWFY